MNRVFNMDLLIDFLGVTLGILVLIILYRLFIRFLSRKTIRSADYCELYEVEFPIAKGEIPFYFTTTKPREVELFLKTSNGDRIDIAHKQAEIGGNICRFDSTHVPNGYYFYVLKTENQEITKRIEIRN